MVHRTRRINARFADVPESMQARGKTPEEVVALLDEGVFDMEKLKAGGWVTDLKYADEVKDMLAEKTGGKDDEFATVPLKRYEYGATHMLALHAVSCVACYSSQSFDWP